MRQSIAGPLGLVVLAFSPLLAAGELTEVVVTANRLAEPEDEALASVSLFTRADIESRQARSLEDLLTGADGVAVGNNGGPGKLTSLFVRGTEADQLLVLVDGVRIGSATAGTAAVQNLPVEMIDRVELVRGPRSSLYGADAIGGVLQVFTRRGGGDWRPDASISGGSFGTRQARAHFGGGDDHAWLQLEGSWEHVRGFDACRGSSTAFAGCYTEEPDRDGYRYRSGSLRAGGALGAHTTVEANLLRASSEVEYDGTFTNRSRLLQQVAGAGITQDLDAFGRLALHAGSAWDRSHDYHDDTFNGFFGTRRDSASLQWDVQPFAAQTFTLGVDFLRDHVDSTTDYTVDSRDDLGVFTQYVAGIGRWRVEASLRGDDNEQFGRHGTGAAAVGYTFGQGLQLLAQYGTGFKAPTFNDLYYPADPVFGPASNEDLKPERSRSLELAVRGMWRQADWRVSLYHTRIRDLIGLDANYLPANIDDARIRGVEASGKLALQGWRLQAGATLQDAEDRGEGSSHGRQLPRRPHIAGNVDVSRRIGAMTLGARWTGQGHRFDDADGTRPLDGYGTLDLRAEAPLARDLRLQLRAANVFDKRYETVAWYNQPGRALYFTLRYEPKP